MPISSVIHTNEQSIDRVLAAGAAVLLVFWSKHTPLSTSLDDTLDKLAQQYAGKAVIAKVDVDAERNLATKYAPPSLPAILLMRNGKADATLVGDDLARAGDWLAYTVDGKPRPQQSAARTAAPQAVGPCTSTPFVSAMPPRRSFSMERG